jgi:hypothetical protein
MPEPADDLDAKAEWARMQGLGGALSRRRTVATVAGTAVLALGFVGTLLMYVVWPFDRIPIAILVVPTGVMMPIAWAVRSRLWPKGQFR